MRMFDHFRGLAATLRLGLIVGLVAAAGTAAEAKPITDPVALNIGLSCQWQQRCMSQQKKAMKRALKFVKKEQLPSWRIEMCNRNASKSRSRVDWVGFHNCVRNSALRPAPPRSTRKAPRRAVQTEASSRRRGERG